MHYCTEDRQLWIAQCSSRYRSMTGYSSRITICAYRTVRGSSSKYSMMFGTEKLEWFSYPMVNNFEDMNTRLDKICERDGRTDGRMDGQTDGHRMTA